MCSVWVHGPGACVSFAVAKFLVLATEELDCSRCGLQRPPAELDARFASSCVGQANKQRAVALRQQTTHHTQSLCSVHTQPRSSSFLINRRAQDVRSRARTRRNPRVCPRVGPRRASRKARDLFRAGNRNCAWAYRQASRCDRVDFQGTRVGDACCQSCKAAKVNELLSQDLEFVLG